MARIDLPYIHKVRKQLAGGRSKVFYYFRRAGFREPLGSDPLSPEFIRRYQELVSDKPTRSHAPVRGSVEAVIAEYKASPAFTQLAKPSKRGYAAYLEELRKSIGQFSIGAIEKKHLLAIQAKRQASPVACNYLIRVAKVLFNFAIDLGYLRENPALRIKSLKTGTGHKVWSESDFEQFRKMHPLGTPMRTALELAIGTGQRQADILKWTWTNYDGEWIDVVQQKTGTRMRVPCPQRLNVYLSQLTQRSVQILTSTTSRPFKADHFRHQFRKALKDAGLEDRKLTFHGLRHTAATELADAGCTPMEIAAILGHRTLSMVERYTKGRSQERLAAKGNAKRERRANDKCKPSL